MHINKHSINTGQKMPRIKLETVILNFLLYWTCIQFSYQR